MLQHRKQSKCSIVIIIDQCWIRNTTQSCADPDGGQGSGPPPLQNHQNIGFLSYTGPDPL